MWLSGLVLLLSVSSAACFNIDIAPPKFGLRRLFRRPYRGPICVIEIIGAELNPRANRGTACPINRAPSHVLSLASGCATRRACEPLTQHVLAADSLQHAQVASTGAVPSACSPRACRTSGWSGRTGRSLARPRSGIVVSSKLDSDPSLNPHPDPNHNPDPKPNPDPNSNPNPNPNPSPNPNHNRNPHQVEECTNSPSWFHSRKLPYTSGVELVACVLWTWKC